MSLPKWKQMAKEKTAVDQQTQDVHQKFRMDKISKEFGQLSGEELFKPIAKRLDEKSSTTAEEVQESPDYTMDEFDEIYLFGDEFRPDAPPPPPPSPTTSYLDVDEVDFPQPPPPLQEKSTRKEWGMPGPVEPEYSHESTLLQTVNQLITKYGDDPNYKVKSKKSLLHGYSVEELKKVRDGIYARRRVTKESLSKRLQEGKQRLKSTPLRKREIPPTPLEKTVTSRRPFFAPSDGDEDFFPEEQDWDTKGSGIADEAEKLIKQLYLSIGSIEAGNSSIKLKNQVLSLLDSLVGLGTINNQQKKKIIHNYIDQ